MAVQEDGECSLGVLSGVCMDQQSVDGQVLQDHVLVQC
jgi:hypothetical protein